MQQCFLLIFINESPFEMFDEMFQVSNKDKWLENNHL